MTQQPPSAGSGEPRMTAEGSGQQKAQAAAKPPAAPKPPKAPLKPTVSRAAVDLREARDTRVQDEREGDDREVTEDRELTEDERLEFFTASLMQEMLPSLPPIPGYHVCWLSTTHKSDTLAWRQRVGYQLIRAEELKGWQGNTGVKAGEDAGGAITCNEMVAAKISLRLFNKMMQHVHDKLPREEESKLRANLQLLKQQAQEMGSDVIEGDGNAELARTARARPMPELTE
jgi:hypothetical protein